MSEVRGQEGWRSGQSRGRKSAVRSLEGPENGRRKFGTSWCRMSGFWMRQVSERL